MRSLLSSVIITMVVASPIVAHAATVLDTAESRVAADKLELIADGIDNAQITVTARDTNLVPLTGKKVTLTSARGALDRIRVESDITDTLGKAYFRVDSLKAGTAVFTARVDGQAFLRTATLVYRGGLSISLKPGDLIKIPDDGDVKTLNDTAVYYYAVNGRRYVFPNEKVFFTWFPDFSKVQIIPLDQMSLIPIGGNVTYQPGSKLVKFQTDPKTYLVTRGGVLRWAKTEDVARGWFGPQWNQHVDDITEAFYVNYTFGQPVERALDLALDVVRATGNTVDADKGLLSTFP